MALYYLDSSAILKSFTEEDESKAFRLWLGSLGDHDDLVTADLTYTEVTRHILRYNPDKLEIVRSFFESINLLRVPKRKFEVAAELLPRELKSLDAIQLACAMSLLESEIIFISYDKRLLDAAIQTGMKVLSPGAR